MLRGRKASPAGLIGAAGSQTLLRGRGNKGGWQPADPMKTKPLSPDAVFLKTATVAMSAGFGLVLMVVAAEFACLPLCLGIGGCLAALR